MCAVSNSQYPSKSSSSSMVATNQEPFSLDIIMEILSRSSFQTISKCRVLSKQCYSLTYESSFMELHSQRTKTISGLFIQFAEHNKSYSPFVSTDSSALSPQFLPCQVQITASTNTGILLCVNVTPGIPQYYVCKPSTKQYRKLPKPKIRHFTLAMGMIVVKSNPLHYKIVRISQPKFRSGLKSDYYNFQTEIFNSETWSWKQVDDVSLSFIPYRRPAVSAGGSLYWPITDDRTILAYRQEENYCSTFSLPEEIHENDYIRLMEYEGRLGVVCGKGAFIELWVVNNSEKKVWSKRLLINCEDVKKEDRHASCLAYYGSDVSLFDGICKLIFYNMKKKSTDVVKEWRLTNLEDVFQFQSDYEPVNFYQGKGKS